MDAIKNNAEKFVFGILLLFSVLFFLMKAGDTAPVIDPEFEKAFEDLNKALSSKDLTDYRYRHIANLKYSDRFNGNFRRIDSIEPHVPSRIIYPCPGKPRINISNKPPTDDQLTIYEPSALGALTDIIAYGDHGRIRITCKLPLPSEHAHMTLVGIDVFRGTSSDTINTKIPYFSISLIEDVPSIAPTAVIPEENKRHQDPLLPRREDRPGPENRDGPKGPENPVVESPELKGLKYIFDKTVTENTTYYYQLRLRGRKDAPPEPNIKIGTPQKIIKYSPPKDAVALPGDATIYASGFTAPVHATSKNNFEIWFTGTTGEISEEGTPPHRIKHDYQVQFVIKVWVTALKQWKTADISVSEREPLKGNIQGSEIEIDTNFDFVEIEWTRKSFGKNLIPEKAAVLKHRDTGKIVKYLLGADPEGYDEKARNEEIRKK